MAKETILQGATKQWQSMNSYEKTGSVLTGFSLYLAFPANIVWRNVTDFEKTYGEGYLSHKTEMLSRSIDEWRELEWFALASTVSVGALILGIALHGMGKYSRWWHSDTN